jgi:Tol biopolymer transport system component
MKRWSSGTAVLVAVLCVSLSGNGDPRLRDADVAWDRGDYPAALAAYLAILAGDQREATLEHIALQTGELFRTFELTSDGGAPRFSPDGRYLTYEVDRGVSRRTRLAVGEPQGTVLAELDGYGASFSADGSTLAYLRLAVTPEMRELEAAADAATGAARTERLSSLNELTETAARITLRDIASGTERAVETGSLRKTAVMAGANGTVLFTGTEPGGVQQIYAAPSGAPPVALTTGEPAKVLQEINRTGTAALFTLRGAGGRGGAGAAGSGGPTARFGVLGLPDGTVSMVTGTAPAFSPDGSSLVYVNRTGEASELMAAPAAAPGTAAVVKTGPGRMEDPALSADGSRIVFQSMSADDWELHVIKRDGTGEERLTREIQHDVAPRFLTGDRILGLIGEPRHRRSYLYDLSSGTRTRLFHNNTVRTIAPEYEWAPSPDGTRLLVVAERDGDTVSPDRGVYMIDLSRKVTRDELIARLQGNLSTEVSLRARGRRMYAPIAAAVAQVTREASIERVYDYQKKLFDFDSKHVSRPGNRRAAEYLFETYKSFGYTPEYQTFAGRGALGGETSNVIATLPGTVNPELVYVVSSHYDSVAIGPGADDDSSGTAALLEAARILARHPQPATIVFASFTGEESGLLGSREFVRRAVADKVRIVGALNNDMIGWANDQRLDNTIRYSNPGIRDVQHAAAIQFSDLITYDAVYYKNTDAHAYYEAYGDIVGGIGSYPVLGNPHYHQSHDLLETINHRLVTEVSKTTAGTLMLMASSPSRLTGLKVDSYRNGAAALSWTPSPEKGITGYIVSWGPPGNPEAHRINVAGPAATIKAPAGSTVMVKAVGRTGLQGWDWARIVLAGDQN